MRATYAAIAEEIMGKCTVKRAKELTDTLEAHGYISVKPTAKEDEIEIEVNFAGWEQGESFDRSVH